jgi:hypothetical protein
VTLAARRTSISLVVHAIDDTGALCGVRPQQGRWRPSKRLPVNCPRCLYVMSRPRYATCETPTASGGSPLHVRAVGAEGIDRHGSSGQTKTLCGMIVGWDIAELRAEDFRYPRICQVCIRQIKPPR